MKLRCSPQLPIVLLAPGTADAVHGRGMGGAGALSLFLRLRARARRRKCARAAAASSRASRNSSPPTWRPRIPDAVAAETFEACRLNWATARRSRATRLARALPAPACDPPARRRAAHSRNPRAQLREAAGQWGLLASTGCSKTARQLHLIANLSRDTAATVRQPAGRILFATHPNIRDAVTRNELAPWSVTWLYERAPERRAVDRAHRKPQ